MRQLLPESEVSAGPSHWPRHELIFLSIEWNVCPGFSKQIVSMPCLVRQWLYLLFVLLRWINPNCLKNPQDVLIPVWTPQRTHVDTRGQSIKSTWRCCPFFETWRCWPLFSFRIPLNSICHVALSYYRMYACSPGTLFGDDLYVSQVWSSTCILFDVNLRFPHIIVWVSKHDSKPGPGGRMTETAWECPRGVASY